MKTKSTCYTSIHINHDQDANTSIYDRDDFCVLYVGDTTIFFDHTNIELLEKMLNAAKEMRIRVDASTDTIRNDTPRIQESKERLLSPDGFDNNIDEQEKRASDIPF
jgi:hypothetical protein